MDINATLTEIRELLAQHDVHGDTDVARLVELVTALDGWLSTGGFLPSPWNARLFTVTRHDG